MDEPQNSLTRKFTETEWTALKELRTLLPLIFEESFPKNENARRDPLTVWGVTLDPNRLDAKTSVVLMHFLRAQTMNVEAAKKMLLDTLRWRAEFDPAKAAEEPFDEAVFGKAGHMFGRDPDGRPIQYNIYGGDVDTTKVFADLDKFMRWRVGLMEKGCMEMDFENVDQMIQVHDYLGVGLSSRTPESKAAAAEATRIFRDYYPETLYKKFFVNVPAFMTWVFWLFRPMLSAQTLAKMEVLGISPITIGKGMLPYIKASELPKQYGGEADPNW
ncbi:CRAL/TRIO domain-containing protein [Dacryopinax primogenitus]|uniref:Phosphatidylinositol transfer protein SFH5 n=1 Tax=Dacryopinax primogenitus (strain DJM 731) TaxID=1858805 RepID=M5G5M4_DACPD|nr:CRAL/TRIO domain-containing protein [Dacryopinax primogenitus]EJU03520.1 CRAL/TRIO domain-containing protein [Dacryopinax primogenitus]